MGKLEYIDRPFEIKEVDEKGHIVGYGSTFGGEPDSYGDVVVKGAFSESIANGGRNGTGIPILYQHDTKEPIGVWTSLTEDSVGLRLEGDLELELSTAKKAHVLAKKKILSGLSIGYDTSGGIVEFDHKKNIRYLKKVNLWEVSLVTFPANINATITDIKSFEDATTERELETVLRDSGLTRRQALYIVKLCRPSLRDLDKTVGSDNLKTILKELQDVNKNLGNWRG